MNDGKTIKAPIKKISGKINFLRVFNLVLFFLILIAFLLCAAFFFIDASGTDVYSIPIIGQTLGFFGLVFIFFMVGGGTFSDLWFIPVLLLVNAAGFITYLLKYRPKGFDAVLVYFCLGLLICISFYIISIFF